MEMFVDKVRITVCGGKGGDGATSSAAGGAGGYAAGGGGAGNKASGAGGSGICIITYTQLVIE